MWVPGLGFGEEETTPDTPTVGREVGVVGGPVAPSGRPRGPARPETGRDRRRGRRRKLVVHDSARRGDVPEECPRRRGPVGVGQR